MYHKRDIVASSGVARLRIHQNHQDLVRVLHMLGHTLFEWKANIADITVVHNEIQFIRTQVKLKPTYIAFERVTVKNNYLSVTLYCDLYVQMFRGTIMNYKVSQISYGGAFR
jgi:hypothetical protein